MFPSKLTSLLLLVSASAGLAQAPTGPVLRPGGRPAAGAIPTLPAPMGAARPPSGNDTVEGLLYPAADVKDVLKQYEKLTGKHLIYDVQAVGPITIDVQGTITRDEAVHIIEISLLMNGFTLVPIGDNLVKVLGTGHNPRGFGIPIISDESQIPETEQVITYVFKLRYADPQEVATTLQQYIVQAASGYNQMLPLPKSQAIVLTENSLIIRKVLQFIKEVDVKPAEVESVFISLDRADAKDVLEKLEKIFEKTPTAGAAGAAPNGARIAARPATTPEGNPIPADASVSSTGPNSIEINGGGLSEDSIIIGKIKLTADTRTNRIHVVTRPVNLRFVRDLIHEFDADIPFGEPAIRPLRFVAAGDVLQTVVDAITEPGQKAENGSGGGGGRSNQNNTSRNATSTNNNLLGNNSNGGLGGSGSGQGSTGLSLSESLNTQERDTMPEARVIGNTKIIADKRANTIIVLGNKEVRNKVFALLTQLDVRAPQVMLHTIIGELNLTNDYNLGVNYILNGGRAGNLGSGTTTTTTTGTTTGTGDGTGTSSAASNLLSITGGNPVLNLANLIGNQKVSQVLTAGSGGFSGFIAAGNAFSALVSALESTDRFRVVSRPSITTTNNKKATIASGEEIAVPVNITGGFTGTSTAASSGLVTQSSIQYKTVALQLEVLPLINSDNEVTLDIVQKVDQQSGSDVIDNNTIPRIATRVLQTTVSVPNQGTLVLGGLIKETNDKSVSGIPGLMKIPVVGALFRKKTDNKTRTELVILIRPEVTVGPSGDAKIREREMEYLNVEPDLESTVFPANVRRKATPIPIRRGEVGLRDTTYTTPPARTLDFPK